ncbi:protease pro-enzyme activation domain-containing protein [Granulicella sp. dw_53]|uniref:protease pro-enzyme activation domain-containing protein n=1 Tax=Granulicella sp. dw_53 TaxID=2719792 RepID=UPI001BD22029|nr:protease pro-enzyme activation domain-containing protein [Granulicella sp. dw_53]
MLRRLSFRPVLATLLLLAAPFTFAAVQNRISSVGSSKVALQHTIPPRALTGGDLGAAPADRLLDSMMLTFSRTDAQQAALNQLLIDLQNPSSSRYKEWVTPEQFGAQFGLSAADLAKVSAWLTSQGFTVTGTSRSSNFISFKGTVAQAQTAFGTTIHSLMVDGEQHISNMTDPVLPTGIAAVVTDVVGLNDLKLKSRARTRVVTPEAADTTGLQPKFTSSVSGSHYIAPGDFYTIYDVKPLLTSSINGAGVTVAIVGQTNIATADVTAFRTASGLGGYCFATLTTGQTISQNSCTGQALPIFATKLYGTSPGTSTPDVPEAMLDVEWAGAVAPGANIIYVNSTDVFTSLISGISDNLAPIFSISYGNCEGALGTSLMTTMNQYFQQANAQGLTVVGPTGDAGATDCDAGNYPAVAGLAVDFPASSPYVTAAGGSMFIAADSAFWSTTNNTNGGSALSYIPEMVWNESSAANGLGAGGGGASSFFSKPYWQIGATVPQDSARDTPDISLNSASGHDGSLYCSSGSCVTGFRAADGQSLSVVGGTSVATPSFAGILALVEQKIGARIGNAGPVLYALANSSSSATVFHDITSGNNSSACTAGTQNCPTGGTIGYSAGTGYDQATGWGSVDAFNLANNWKVVTPISATAGAGQGISVTTLSTANPVCGTAANIVLAVKVAGTSATVPTGTVQIFVDGVANGSPVALSGGTASYTLATSGLASGGHTVSAVYSGDSVYAGSKASLLGPADSEAAGLLGGIDVVSATKPDFSFTPCVASTTVASGGTAPAVVFTIAPVNGFTGTVTLSASTADSDLAAGYTFSVSPVVVSSGTSATTNFVLTAFASTAGGFSKQVNSTKQISHPAPWYVAGSGAALASALLLVLPRRRRWGALLAAVLSVAAFGALGCGSGAVSAPGTGTGGTGTGTGTGGVTNATAGTYTIRVTASSTTATGTVVHSANVTFKVQ